MLATIYESLKSESGLTVHSSTLALLRIARMRMRESAEAWCGRRNRNWRHAMLRSLASIHQLQQSRVW